MPARPVRFPKPLPPVGVTWATLTPAQQHIWIDWSRSNPVSDTDFTNSLRHPPSAFQIISSNWNADQGMDMLLTYPLPEPTFRPGILSTGEVLMMVEPEVEIRFALGAATTAEERFQIWATEDFSPTETPPLHDWRFITTLVVPPGGSPGEDTPNFAPEYEAVWGTGWRTIDQRIVFAAFHHSKGQLKLSAMTHGQNYGG